MVQACRLSLEELTLYAKYRDCGMLSPDGLELYIQHQYAGEFVRDAHRLGLAILGFEVFLTDGECVTPTSDIADYMCRDIHHQSSWQAACDTTLDETLKCLDATDFKPDSAIVFCFNTRTEYNRDAHTKLK